MPVKKMSALWLSKLKYPETGRVEYSDTEQKGLVLRVGASSMTWFCVYRIAGQRKQHRIKIGRYPSISYAEAKKKAKAYIVKADKGEDPATEKQQERQEQLSAPSFKFLAETYLIYHAERHKRAKSISEDKRILDKDLLPAWGKLKAKDIKRRHVIELLDNIASRGPIIANRTLALASTIFNVGIDRELVEFNPCYRVKKPGGKEESRERVLSEEEIKSIWFSFSSLTPKMKFLMKIRMLTAQRGSEVCSMSWNDIDFKEKIWTIPSNHTKNGKSHRVPITQQMEDVLNEIKEFLKKDNERLTKRGKAVIESDWLFPSNHGSSSGYIKNIQKAAQKIQEVSGVPDFRLHDMRRSAASMMASMGITEFTIGKVLNHTNESITSVYNRHTYDAEKRRALEKWSNRLDLILKGKQAKIINLR